MNGLELFLLGRRLMKLGEDAIPHSTLHDLPTSVRSVLVDSFLHPGTSISDIVARTGFPQSHVSGSVAKLRALGVVVTEVDPSDHRRTLVSPAPGAASRGAEHASGPIDETIANALGAGDPNRLGEVVSALELLARRLMPGAEARIRTGTAGPSPFNAT